MEEKSYFPVKGCPSCEILNGELQTLIWRYRRERDKHTHDLLTETKERCKEHYNAAHEDPQVILREQYSQVARELGLAAGEFLVYEITHGPWMRVRGKLVAAVIAALKTLYKAIPEGEKHPAAEHFKKAAHNYADWYDKYYAFDEKEK